LVLPHRSRLEAVSPAPSEIFPVYSSTEKRLALEICQTRSISFNNVSLEFPVSCLGAQTILNPLIKFLYSNCPPTPCYIESRDEVFQHPATFPSVHYSEVSCNSHHLSSFQTLLVLSQFVCHEIWYIYHSLPQDKLQTPQAALSYCTTEVLIHESLNICHLFLRLPNDLFQVRPPTATTNTDFRFKNTISNSLVI